MSTVCVSNSMKEKGAKRKVIRGVNQLKCVCPQLALKQQRA